MSSAADADAGDRLHYSKPSDRARPRYRTPTSSRERRAPAGPNRSPTKYTYLFFFSNLLANLSVPKWRPSGRIPGIARARVIENPSSILVSPPCSSAPELLLGDSAWPARRQHHCDKAWPPEHPY